MHDHEDLPRLAQAVSLVGQPKPVEFFSFTDTATTDDLVVGEALSRASLNAGIMVSCLLQYKEQNS